MLQLPAVFSTVPCCTDLQPGSPGLDHTAQECGGLDHLGVFKCTVMFTQQNHLTMQFSEHIPIIQQGTTVYENLKIL